MYDVRLIHNADTEQWAYYFVRQLKNELPGLRVLQQKDSDLISCCRISSSTRSSCNTTDSAFSRSSASDVEASSVVVIVSPLHVVFLHENPDFRYDSIVAGSGLAQLFLCGTELDAFQELDCNGVSIAQRFQNLDDWTLVPATDPVRIVANVVSFLDLGSHHRLPPDPDAAAASAATATRPKSTGGGSRKRKKAKFTIKPNHIKGNCSTLLTILFEKELAKQSNDGERSELKVIFDENRGCQRKSFRVNAEYCNPYTYQFNAPPHSSGNVRVKVILDDLELGSTWLTYMPSSSLEVDVVGMLVETHIRLIVELIASLDQLGILSGDVDHRLANVIESGDRQATEHLFSCLRPINYDPTQFQYPTLLHVAARYGLEDLCQRLLELPDVRLAILMASAENRTPVELAKEYNHYNVTQLIQEHENNDDNMAEDDYVPTDQNASRIRDSDSPADTSDISEDDDSDDGSGYMDMNNVMKEIAFKRSRAKAETTGLERQSSRPKSETDLSQETTLDLSSFPRSPIHLPEKVQAGEGCEEISKSTGDVSLVTKEIRKEPCFPERSPSPVFSPLPPSPSPPPPPCHPSPPPLLPRHPPPPASLDIDSCNEPTATRFEAETSAFQPRPVTPQTPARTERERKDSADEQWDRTDKREDKREDTSEPQNTFPGQEPNVTLPEDQKELISILRQMATQQMPFNEGELLIKELELRQKTENVKKQEDLQKIREQINLTERKKQSKKASLWQFLGRRPSDLGDKACSKTVASGSSYVRQMNSSTSPPTNTVSPKAQHDGQFNFGQKTKRYSKKVEPYTANIKTTEDSALVQPEINSDPVSESGSRESFRSANSFTSNSSGADLNVLEEEPNETSATTIDQSSCYNLESSRPSKNTSESNKQKTDNATKSVSFRSDSPGRGPIPADGRRRSRSLSNIGKTALQGPPPSKESKKPFWWRFKSSSSASKSKQSYSPEQQCSTPSTDVPTESKSGTLFSKSKKTRSQSPHLLSAKAVQAADGKKVTPESIESSSKKTDKKSKTTKTDPNTSACSSPAQVAGDDDGRTKYRKAGEVPGSQVSAQVKTSLNQKQTAVESNLPKKPENPEKTSAAVKFERRKLRCPEEPEVKSTTGNKKVLKHSGSVPLLSQGYDDNDDCKTSHGKESAEISRSSKVMRTSSAAGQTESSFRNPKLYYSRSPAPGPSANADTSGKSRAANNATPGSLKADGERIQTETSKRTESRTAERTQSPRVDHPSGSNAPTLSGHPVVKPSQGSGQRAAEEACQTVHSEKKKVHPPFPTISPNAPTNSPTNSPSKTETEIVGVKMSATSDHKEVGFCILQSNPSSSAQVSNAQIPLETKQEEDLSNKDTKTGTTDNNNTSTERSAVEHIAPGGSSNPEEGWKQGSFLENSERNLVLPSLTSGPSTSHSPDGLSAREQCECDNDALNRICDAQNKNYAMDNYHQAETQSSILPGNLGKSESVDDEVGCCCHQVIGCQKKDDVVNVDEITDRRKEAAPQEAQSQHECVESKSETLNETKLINTENIYRCLDDTKPESVPHCEDLQQEKKTSCQKVNERIKATVDSEVVGCQTSETPQDYDRTSVYDNVLTKRLTWRLSATQASGGICSQPQSSEDKSECEPAVNDKNIGQCSTTNETKEHDFSGNEENIDVSNVEKTRDPAETNEFITNQEFCDSVSLQSTLDYLSANVSEEEKRKSGSTDEIRAAQQIVEIEQENLADETKSILAPGTTESRQSHASNTLEYSGIVEEGQTPRGVDSTQKYSSTPTHPDAGTVQDKRNNTRCKRPQTQLFSKSTIGTISFSNDDDGCGRSHSLSAPGSRNSSPGRTAQGHSSAAVFPRSSPVFPGGKTRQEEDCNDDVFYLGETPNAEVNVSVTPSPDDNCGRHQSSEAVVTSESNFDAVQNIDSASAQSEAKETSGIRITDDDQTANQSPVQLRRQTTLERTQPGEPRLSSSSRSHQRTSENPRNSFPGILSLPQKLQQHLERQKQHASKRHTIADQPCAASQTLPLPTGNTSRAVSSDPELSTSTTGSNPPSQFGRSKHPPSTLPKPKRRPMSESFGVRSDQPVPGRAKRHSTYERRVDHEAHANQPGSLARLKPKTLETSAVEGTTPSGETKDGRNVIDSIVTSEKRRINDDVDNPQTISEDVTKSVGDVTMPERKSSSQKHVVPHLTFRPFVDVTTASATLQLRFSQPRPHSMCSPISEEHHGLLPSEPETSTLTAAAAAAANRPPLTQCPGGVRPQSSIGVPPSVGCGSKRHARSKSLSINVQRKRSQIDEGCDKKTE